MEKKRTVLAKTKRLVVKICPYGSERSGDLQNPQN